MPSQKNDLSEANGKEDLSILAHSAPFASSPLSVSPMDNLRHRMLFRWRTSEHTSARNASVSASATSGPIPIPQRHNPYVFSGSFGGLGFSLTSYVFQNVRDQLQLPFSVGSAPLNLTENGKENK